MTPYHDPTGDEMEYRYFCYLADKFEAEPSLLRIPLETIQKWVANGHWASARLQEWSVVIERAQQSRPDFQNLMKILRGREQEDLEMKGYDPFPAVLGEAEKEQFLWISRH